MVEPVSAWLGAHERSRGGEIGAVIEGDIEQAVDRDVMIDEGDLVDLFGGGDEGYHRVEVERERECNRRLVEAVEGEDHILFERRELGLGQ